MKFIIFFSLLLFSFSIFAHDQQSQIDAVKKFIGTNSPMLLEGHDEVGECRIMIYSAISAEASNIWFEGTFQSPEDGGPVAGFAVPLLISSSSETAKIENFEIDTFTLSVTMWYPGEPSYSMYLEKASDKTFKSVAYTVGVAKRKCLNLKRIL